MNGSKTQTGTQTGTPAESSGGNAELPAREAAIEEWGPRINEYCRQSAIDWRQFEGSSVVMGTNVHPFTETTRPLLSYFQDLTGINVVYNTFQEEELWNRVSRDMENQTGQFDGMFLGLWPSAGYHSNGWLADLTTFIDDPSLTDRDWLHLEDFPDSSLDSFTYLGTMDGDGELVALPFGIEVFGCVGYDQPTFETLGLSEPETFEELQTAAQMIHESDEVDKSGIVSRASDATLSTANWATMFKSHGADWIDYENREAALDTETGVASLETYATLLDEYGPDGVGDFGWYEADQAFANGNVGIIYATPQAAGLFTDQQYERTEWAPPLEGPNDDRTAATWQWGLGVSEYSRNPEATWLFLQWATSRPMSYLVSTQQWRGQSTYGHARTEYIFDQDESASVGHKDSWTDAFSGGLSLVPESPPPIPFHTPQNMDIMNHAATAMNRVIVGDTTAEAALADAADLITPLVEEIPAEYIV
jgi:multiple sugar transport system substrate-binding protein